MTDSLENESNDLGQVRLKHIETLVDLLRTSMIKQKDHVRRRYCERASHFDATLQFVSQLGCVQDDGESLSLSPDIAHYSVDENTLSGEVLSRFCAHGSPFRRDLSQYLVRFCVVDEQVVYRPIAQRTSSESELRNLLMDLEVVSHDATAGMYVLNPKFNGLYTQFAREVGVVAPGSISARRTASEAVGSAAEDVVLSYERQRVGEAYAAQVKHVAQVDAAAGYDIESVTVLSGSMTVPRLIEVKAVPAGNLRFYWSSNEVATARRFGSWYYLYLLPVQAEGRLDTDRLVMLENPYQTVVLDSGDWCVEPDVLRCEMKDRPTHGCHNSNAGAIA